MIGDPKRLPSSTSERSRLATAVYRIVFAHVLDATSFGVDSNAVHGAVLNAASIPAGDAWTDEMLSVVTGKAVEDALNGVALGPPSAFTA